MPTTLEDAVTALNALHTDFTNHTNLIAGAGQAAADTAAAKTAAEADATSIDATKTVVDGQAAAIATAIGDINNVITPKLPLMNILPDGGRYAGAVVDPRDLQVSSFVSSNEMIVGFNGTPEPVEVGKFITDNTDNGGAAGSMTQTTIDLIAATGRTGSAARWGTEFFIAEYTMGTSTVGNVVEVDHYYMLNTSAKSSIHDASSALSFAAWLRVISGSVALRQVDGLWVDGIEQAGNHLVTAVDGWIHFAGVTSDDRGYVSTLPPHISAQANTVVQLALPVFCPGFRQMPVHAAPVVPFAV